MLCTFLFAVVYAACTPTHPPTELTEDGDVRIRARGSVCHSGSTSLFFFFFFYARSQLGKEWKKTLQRRMDGLDFFFPARHGSPSRNPSFSSSSPLPSRRGADIPEKKYAFWLNQLSQDTSWPFRVKYCML